MTTEPWAIRSRRVVDPGPASARRGLDPGRDDRRGRAARREPPSARAVEDVGDLLVLPGLVDTHVHINDPGRADWEGFATATAAAAAGGITTLVDMPLNSDPVTTTPDGPGRQAGRRRGAGSGSIAGSSAASSRATPTRSSRWPTPGSSGSRRSSATRGSTSSPNVARGRPPRARCRSWPAGGSRCWPTPSWSRRRPRPMDPADPRSYAAWLASRPESWEVEAIRLLIGLCRETGCRVHVVHLAAAEALPMIAEARAEGLPLTVETCPHYLTFAAEEIPDGDTRFKCAPPIRSAANREGLWEGLRSGLIDTIGTDHSPAPPGLKHLDTGDLVRGPGAGSRRSSSPCRPSGPRPAAGGSGSTTWPDGWPPAPPRWSAWPGGRGRSRPGPTPTSSVFDPEASFVVDPAALHHRHPATPYEGRTLVGRVVATYLRGARIASRRPARGRTRRAGPSGGGLDRLNALGRGRGRRRAAPLLRLAAVGRPDGGPPAVRLRGGAARGRRRGLATGSTTPTASKPSRPTRGSATSTRSGRGSPRPPRGPPASRPASPAPTRRPCGPWPRGTATTRPGSATSSSSAPPARRPARCSPCSASGSATTRRPSGRSPPRSRPRSPGSASGSSAHEPDHDPRPRPRPPAAPPRGSPSPSRPSAPTADWDDLARGVTDADGRVRDLLPAGAPLAAGTYRLRFETGDYFRSPGRPSLLPLGRRRLPGRRPLGPYPRPAAAQPVRLLDLPGELSRPSRGRGLTRGRPSRRRGRGPSGGRARHRS